ncbi:MAG: ATP-binding protein [Acidobacteriota bacterium]|nr:ATP-binding protein [Acidobacteriota bacterium]
MSPTPPHKSLELLREKEMLHEFIRTSTEYIFSIDFSPPVSTRGSVDELVERMFRNGRFGFVNERFARGLGLALEDLIGRPCTAYFKQQANQEVIEALVQSGFSLFDFESVGLVDGEEFYLLNNMVGTVENGYLLRLFGTARDITAQKQADSENIRQREQLMHMNRIGSLGQMASSVAHELNQPLTAIRLNAGAVKMMQDKGIDDPGETLAIMDDILADVSRAGEVIQQMRDLYIGRVHSAGRYDLGTIIANALRLLNSELLVGNIRLVREHDGSSLGIEANEIQIQQLLINLIMNACAALRSMDSVKNLTVRTRREDSRIILEIRDNGPGFPQEDPETAFLPFVTTREDGSGMGLSICRTIIEAHHGTIGARNAEHGGALVTVVLPAIEGP